jgi:dTMP kinase
MFGTAASLAGIQNRVKASIRNCATNSQIRLSTSGIEANSPNRMMSVTTIVFRRSNRSANAPARGPRTIAGSRRNSSTPPSAKFAAAKPSTSDVAVAVSASSPSQSPKLDSDSAVHSDAMTLTYNGAAITMLLFGLLASVLGLAAYRQMDDRRGLSLMADLRAAYRNEAVGPPRESRRDMADGFFLALEGGEGVGKSTQARMLADWLRAKGHEVVSTFEPGGTPVGQRLRTELLGVRGDGAALSPRAEALLFAADRAEHVATVIRPALARGAVVVSDRFVDSSIAYQGAGRELEPGDVARISRWATDGLRPDLTVLLDLPPEVGL